MSSFNLLIAAPLPAAARARNPLPRAALKAARISRFGWARETLLWAPKAKQSLSTKTIGIVLTSNPPEGKGNAMTSSQDPSPGEREPPSRAVQTVLDALEKLRFGAIQLTVHEGRLVQVDVTERHRYPN
jgi:hypothetical protein